MAKEIKKVSDGFLTKVLIALGIFLVLFVIVVLVLFALTGLEPSVLIASVFGACTGEAGLCAWIKKKKDKISEEASSEDTTSLVNDVIIDDDSSEEESDDVEQVEICKK